MVTRAQCIAQAAEILLDAAERILRDESAAVAA